MMNSGTGLTCVCTITGRFIPGFIHASCSAFGADFCESEASQYGAQFRYGDVRECPHAIAGILAGTTTRS